jgi:hypothetical protein
MAGRTLVIKTSDDGKYDAPNDRVLIEFESGGRGSGRLAIPGALIGPWTISLLNAAQSRDQSLGRVSEGVPLSLLDATATTFGTASVGIHLQFRGGLRVDLSLDQQSLAKLQSAVGDAHKMMASTASARGTSH